MDSNKSITSDFKIESSFNTTGLFAYIINTNGVLNKELTINLLLYKVEEDNTNTYLKTISKKFIVDKDTVVVSFEVPKDIKVFVKTYNSSTLSVDNINSIYVVRLEGNEYIYDSNDHLIKVLNPDSITVYEDYQKDNPTKVTTTNIKDNKVMVSKYNYNSNNQMTYQEDYLGNVLEVEFNELGQVVEKRSYNIKEPTLCKKERYKYDDFGNVATLDGVLKDGDGNIPSTSIKYLRGLESKVKSPSGNVVNYGYDFNTDKLVSLSSEVNGISNVTRFKYKRNLLESLEHDGFKVSYKFDKLERITEVLVNNETYLTTEYDDNFSLSEASIYYGNKVTTTYNNGYVTSSLFDIDGLLRRIYKDSNYKAYTYDNKENIISVITNDGTINKTYEYDSYDNIIKETSTGNGSVYTKEYNYDDKQRLSNEVDTYNNKTFNYDYSYNEQIDSLLDSISLSVADTNINKSYGYDVLNRKNKECLSINDEEFIKEEYEYLAVEDNALDLIKEHNIVFKGNLLESDTYEYDLNGNIIKVITDENEIRYHYDSLSRLIREDNPLLNKTITYKYDKKGNITLRKEYTYSLDINLLNPNKIDKFTYGLKNELLKYNDEECVYDSMGRPTTYRGMTTSWNSDGTLANMGGKYSYIRRNFDGMIYERREGTHPYPVNNTITDGNKILVDNGLTFIYILDKLVGFVYNENRYYYQRNILGDITHIYSEDGVLVAKYVYYGYGRHKVLNSLNEEDTNLYSIGNLNPFRYRGYYYDRVLGLYNLVSRYYDPEVCRFISPDTISILDKTRLDINGLNLYSCNNVMINRLDKYRVFLKSKILLKLENIDKITEKTLLETYAKYQYNDFYKRTQTQLIIEEEITNSNDFENEENFIHNSKSDVTKIDKNYRGENKPNYSSPAGAVVSVLDVPTIMNAGPNLMNAFGLGGGGGKPLRSMHDDLVLILLNSEVMW